MPDGTTLAGVLPGLCIKVDSPVLSVAYSPDGTKPAAGLGYPTAW